MTHNQTGTLAPAHSRANRRQVPDRFVPALAPGRRERVGVVHLAWEYMPLARTGGLGEAVSGLTRFQAASGKPTTVVMPLHRCVREVAKRLEPAGPSFPVPLGSRVEVARLFRLVEPRLGPAIYMIENAAYFDRPGIYGDGNSDYPDNARRFALFAKAALAVLPKIAPSAHILHTHDWHTALAPVYLRTAHAGEPYYDRLGTVLSVHNAGFQGHFPAETVADLGLAPELYDARLFEWFGQMNILKGGLAFSDVVVTVSPSHGGELRTPQGGFGLDHTFTALGDRLVGIVNGIDSAVWNPQTDPAIAAPYSRADLTGKQRCKVALQRSFGLAVRPQVPLFGMSARLVEQKGLDLILDGALLAMPDAQFIFLGEGESRYARALTDLAAAAPDRIAAQVTFADRVEHELLAGADMLLMPSQYEPCGLTQMRAQLYGTIPVARRVGGLGDTIEDGATGFLFDEYSPEALVRTTRRAIKHYADPHVWHRMMRAAMSQDFGGRRSGESYLKAYGQALAVRGTHPSRVHAP
ncbi:MAG: glycogen synthase [Gammaproteobacteria bacterium]